MSTMKTIKYAGYNKLFWWTISGCEFSLWPSCLVTWKFVLGSILWVADIFLESILVTPKNLLFPKEKMLQGKPLTNDFLAKIVDYNRKGILENEYKNSKFKTPKFTVKIKIAVKFSRYIWLNEKWIISVSSWIFETLFLNISFINKVDIMYYIFRLKNIFGKMKNTESRHRRDSRTLPKFKVCKRLTLFELEFFFTLSDFLKGNFP